MRPNWEQDLRKLERLLPSLPCFVTKYVDHKMPDLSPSSLLMYGRDYKQFLEWLIVERLPSCSTIKEVTLQHLEQLYMEDIDAFKAYLRVRKNNSLVTRERKIAALKSLFHYLSQVAEDENHYPLLKRNVLAIVQLKSRKGNSVNISSLEGKILETDN
jgi:site-specific recombinase XerD